MIIEAIITAFLAIFGALFSLFKFPSMPDGVQDIISTFVEYLATGIAIVSNYVDMSYLLSLFTIVALVEGAILIYHFIMWIVRKIPVSTE